MNRTAIPFASIALTMIAFFSAVVVGDTPASSVRPGVFVAVGYGGRRMSSRDGMTWQNVQQWVDKGEDDSNNLISVVFGKGKFVAVGGGGWSRDTQAGHILISTDGAKWREVKKMQFRISPILFDGSRFVAGAPDKQLIYSDDGENWSLGAKVELPKELPGWAFWFRHAAASPGNFVFMGNANKDQKTWWCFTSHDGQTTASFSVDLPPVRSLCFGGGKFLLVSTDALYTSGDGQRWTRGAASPADAFDRVVWTGKEFYLTAKKGTYTSPDGVAWKPLGKPIPCGILWTDGSLFLGSGWPGKMFASTDGIKWEKGEQPMPGLGINQIAYGVPSGLK
ncbi:MAG TPA: hypothetical protein VG326_11245 [Tepidisphaeraceae bacterium]|jgi:hypothetical protein|nr:hypothetical protein [Tepidisphaeraceae bacterium]